MMISILKKINPVRSFSLFFILFSFYLLFLAGCYEPVEGCLDLDAVNYDVTADNACNDCCTYPALTLSMQHLVQWPHDSVSLRYGVLYPVISTPQPADSFLIERARFFISNLLLLKDDGTQVHVEEQLELELANGEKKTIPDNFAKLDRDFFQPRKLGTIKTEGVVTALKFTLGLEEFLQQNEIVSGLPDGHPLDTTTDTISYRPGEGIAPVLLIVRHDTSLFADSLLFRFTQPLTVTLPLDAPFVIKKGFDVELTLRTNYMDWVAGADFQNDSPQTISDKIADNLPNVFSVTEIKLKQ